MEFQDWMFDKRVVRRNVRRGLIAKDDVTRYLEALPDRTEWIVDPEEDVEHYEGRGEYPSDDDFDEDEGFDIDSEE